MRSVLLASCAVPATLLAVLSTSVSAQLPAAAPRSWEVAGLPFIGYDADEGFGHGAFAEVYRRRAGRKPYVWTVRPAVDLSTRGRRDVTVFSFVVAVDVGRSRESGAATYIGPGYLF